MRIVGLQIMGLDPGLSDDLLQMRCADAGIQACHCTGDRTHDCNRRCAKKSPSDRVDEVLTCPYLTGASEYACGNNGYEGSIKSEDNLGFGVRNPIPVQNIFVQAA